MVKSPIKVFVRARPVGNSLPKNIYISEEEGLVSLNIPKNESKGHINHQVENWNFRFDGVLTNSSQEAVYELIAKDIIQSALEGYSGTIFCYGQTGAGKTFTMSGSTSSYKHRGIIPRTISTLFQEIGTRTNEEIEVKVSYLEVYNDTMLDLVNIHQDSAITINEDGKGGILVKGLSQTLCVKEEEGLNLLFQGELNKAMSQHKMNKTSSRAHSIFTIYIQSKCKVGSTKKTICSKINLVDLAGSERTKKTGSEGQTLVEANHINKSLSFLEQVVSALSEKQREHVPYRQSKLTYLLKDSIGGNCKTIMIANIWPNGSNLDETISTLKFATRIKKVSNDATANVLIDYLSPQKKMESPCFKNDFFMNDTFGNIAQAYCNSFTAEEKSEQNKLAKQYLNSEIDDIEVKSYPQMKELFAQFKCIYGTLFDATKEFFHLIPSEKLQELGISEDFVLRNVNNGEKNRVTRFEEDDKMHNKNMDHSMNQSHNPFNGITITPPVKSLGKKHSSPEIYQDLTDKENKDLDIKLIKGIAGLIRQRTQGKTHSDKSLMTPYERNKCKSPVQQEQSLTTEEDLLEENEEQKYYYSKNVSNIKQRFKDNSEKISELKSNISSTSKNIHKSKSLVVENLEDIFHLSISSPKQGYLQGEGIRDSQDLSSLDKDWSSRFCSIESNRKPGFVYRMKE